MSSPKASDLAAAVLRADRSSIAAALNLIDDRRPDRRREADDLLRRLEAEARETPRVGFTGAPGAGKSTLLDAVTRVLRERGETVGIIAVDPSSQRTGGALLGDRIRVRQGSRDSGVFFRSMAARDRLGGLAAATRAGVTVLEAAFDWVLVETVGVGQSEGEVAHLVDTLVYVAQPGAGDILQFMKAGLVELPDVFAVNKADLGAAASQTASELRSGIALGAPAAEGWERPVLLVSARDGRGIGALVDALIDHRASQAGAAFEERRRSGRDHFVLTELLRRYGSYGVEAAGGSQSVRKRLAGEPGASAFQLVDAIASEIEERISGRVS